jgi:hypothetical protein
MKLPREDFDKKTLRDKIAVLIIRRRRDVAYVASSLPEQHHGDAHLVDNATASALSPSRRSHAIHETSASHEQRDAPPE